MHYSKTAFSKEGDPTIVTNIPAFSDVIGQRMEFSDSDLLKLHRLYNCSKKCWINMITCFSHTHLSCNFIILSPSGEKTTNGADKEKPSPGVRLIYGVPKGDTCLSSCLPAGGSTFLDSCDFERENICGMIQGQGDKADWVRVASVAGGPPTDYSNLGKCSGEYTQQVTGKTQLSKHRPSNAC